jgi:hypothetical protein
MVTVAAGCSSPPPGPVPSPPAVSGTGTGTAVAVAGFCRVGLPRSWQDALAAGRLTGRPGERLIVHAASPDGEVIAVDVRIAGRRGLVLLRHGTQRRTVVDFPHPDTQQTLAADFDGRWLVYVIGHDRAEPNDWTLYAWDSVAAGKPEVLADNHVRRLRGPWLLPVVRDGQAAWVAGAGNGKSELHLFDLTHGTGKIIDSGAATTPVFFGNWLLWRAGYDDAGVPVGAADARTGDPAALPALLHEVRSHRFLAADRQTLVWATDARTLVAWRPGWPAPRTVVAVGEQEAAQWPAVAGDLITWGTAEAKFVADLRTGSQAQVTWQYGVSRAWYDTLMVSQRAPDVGTATPGQRQAEQVSVVRASRLPRLPDCR